MLCFFRRTPLLRAILRGGTTLIAAEKVGVCYGMELDPGYCDVIVSRYVNHTGGAVVLNGKKVKWKVDG